MPNAKTEGKLWAERLIKTAELFYQRDTKYRFLKAIITVIENYLRKQYPEVS